MSRITRFIGGLIITKYCKCKKYKPTSTTGLIITACRKCGKEPKELILM